jgi:hypothetical protein
VYSFNPALLGARLMLAAIADPRYAMSVLAGVLLVCGMVPYARSIVSGETKPAKASWLIWVGLDWIILGGMYLKHKVNGQILAACVFGLIIVALSLKFGTPGWKTRDKVCLSIGAAAIALGLLDPTLAIVTSLTGTVVASWPTIEEAWAKPEQESRAAWTIYWSSCVAALLSLDLPWSIQSATQPVVFMAIETVMLYIVWIRRATLARRPA